MRRGDILDGKYRVDRVLGSGAARRIGLYLERRGALEADDGVDAADNDNGGQLEASAVSGQVPPAGPQWQRGLRALEPRGLAYDKPLCASLDGFTLHAATRAGALDTAGREALLRYVLRPPVAHVPPAKRPRLSGSRSHRGPIAGARTP